MSSFEIKIQEKKSEELPSQLKNRLFISKKTLTREEIEEKLQKANAKRQELLQVRVPAKDKIALTQERRESFEVQGRLKV